MNDLPRMLSKREIELEELEEAKYVQSLRDENQKLQEQNKTMKLALVELSDENIYDNTGFFADEYAKNLVEQLDAGEIETIAQRSCSRLQQQLNTAKKALTEISVIPTKFDDGGAGEIAVETAHDALAAI